MKEQLFLTYTAGFFDADGSVGVYFSKRKGPGHSFGGEFFLHMTLYQRQWMSIFQEWHDRWGGGLHPRSEKGERRGWEWHLVGHSALGFLKDVLPFLRKKREQARLAILFQERKAASTLGNGGPGANMPLEEFEWRKGISDQIKALKRSKVPRQS